MLSHTKTDIMQIFRGNNGAFHNQAAASLALLQTSKISKHISCT